MNSEAQQDWTLDHLGEDFESLTLDLGQDPDNETDIVATLVRYTKAPKSTHNEQSIPAILYIHGMSDYFFQAHVAEYFASQGIAFYALDLRKCGRSWREGQSFHYVTDLRFYFKELNQALEIITQSHQEVIPLGHSTGGLIGALWLDDLRREHKPEHAHIKAAVFNSPWLDLMAPRLVTFALGAVLNPLGKKKPHAPFPLGALDVYGQSVHRDEQGFWDFNKEWKPMDGQPKYLGWMRTILMAQRRIQLGKINTGVPTLTLCSDKSYKGKTFAPEAQQADSILWVEQIQRWAPKLSRNSTVRTIPDALHDVYLSGDVARNMALSATSSWLHSLEEK